MNRARNAFTLIELLVSLAIGSLLLVVVYAAFRTSLQAISSTRKLSLENRVLRAGFIAALEECDWWDLYDDRGDATAQRLRAAPADANGNWGLPFAPMTAVFAPRPTGAGAPDEDTRWWAKDYPWPAHDPLTWCRSTINEGYDRTYGGERRAFGNYGLFSHVKDAPVLEDPANAGAADYGAVPAGVVDRHWRDRQFAGLLHALGPYGLIDYLPANAFFALNGDPGDDRRYGTADDRDVEPERRFLPIGVQGNMPFTDHAFARPLYYMTKDQSFAVPAPRFITPLPDEGRLREAARSLFKTGRYGESNDDHWSFTATIRGRYEIAKPLLASPPPEWPVATLMVLRSYTYARATNVFRVRWTSPVTGELVEIAFTAQGTTLRGARQQRGLD